MDIYVQCGVRYPVHSSVDARSLPDPSYSMPSATSRRAYYSLPSQVNGALAGTRSAQHSRDVFPLWPACCWRRCVCIRRLASSFMAVRLSTSSSRLHIAVRCRPYICSGARHSRDALHKAGPHPTGGEGEPTCHLSCFAPRASWRL